MTADVDGARGERARPERRVAPLAVLALVLVSLALAATIALAPHRTQRDLTRNVRSVRVWNAMSARCQLERDGVEPLPYTCGAYHDTHLHVSADAPPRAWAALSSQRDNCVIDEETLESVVCRDTLMEWAAVARDFASVASVHPAGTNFVITQRHLVTGEVRQIDVPLSYWFDRRNVHEVFVMGPDGSRSQIAFGRLVPVGQ